MKLKNNRKIIVNCIASLAVLLLCIFLLPISALADSQGTVNDNNVNIRSQADASSTSLGKVNSGDKVTILEEVTNSSNVVWYKIQTAAGTTGYIRSDFITKAATGNDNTPSTGTAPSPDANTTPPKTPTVTNTDPKAAYISGDVVNIRSQASASSDLIAKAQKNTEVTVTGEVTASDGYKWYKVTFSADGGSKTGFIRSDLLTFTKPTNTPAETNIDSTTTDPATPDTADPEAGETPAETPVEEPAETDTEKPAETTEPKRTISPLQPSSEPSVIPDGFNEVSLETGEKVWNKGDYYIIYGMNEKETIGWYVLDEKNSTYISYDGFLEKSTASKKGDATKIFGINIKVILVILIVLVIILLGVVFFMALKLSRGVENDDDYDYDDYEDEEDEEDIPVSSIENSRRSRGRREREPEPEEEYEEKAPVRSKAARAKDKFLNYFTNEVDDEGDEEEYYDDADEEDDDIDFIDI
ncbi:MAG: SH3 domain-containing protein [Lachnospiraceae bacterium]|nr:SH3 domain-containing protein [Lachnospiraceae bacterium]